MANGRTTCLKLWLWMLSGLASQRNFLTMLVVSALWTSSLDSSVMLLIQLQLWNGTLHHFLFQRSHIITASSLISHPS